MKHQQQLLFLIKKTTTIKAIHKKNYPHFLPLFTHYNTLHYAYAVIVTLVTIIFVRNYLLLLASNTISLVFVYTKPGCIYPYKYVVVIIIVKAAVITQLFSFHIFHSALLLLDVVVVTVCNSFLVLLILQRHDDYEKKKKHAVADTKSKTRSICYCFGQFQRERQ